MNEDSNVCIPRWLEGELLPDGYNEQPNPYAEMPTSKYNLRALVNYALSNGKMVTELSKEEADYSQWFLKALLYRHREGLGHGKE